MVNIVFNYLYIVVYVWCVQTWHELRFGQWLPVEWIRARVEEMSENDRPLHDCSTRKDDGIRHQRVHQRI